MRHYAIKFRILFVFVIEDDVVILVNYERNNSSRNVRNAYNVQYFILKKYLLSMLGNIPTIPYNYPVTQSQSEFYEETIDFNYDETELNSCNFPSLQ